MSLKIIKPHYASLVDQCDCAWPADLHRNETEADAKAKGSVQVALPSAVRINSLHKPVQHKK